MAHKATAAEVVLEALAGAETNGCSFEQLINVCPGLTWNQIFLEVDRLSRDSRVLLSHDMPGVYRVRLPKTPSSTSVAMGRR